MGALEGYKPKDFLDPSKQELKSYLRSHHWKINKTNIEKARNRLRHKKRNEYSRFLRAKEHAAAEPNPPWQIVYGFSKLGGTFSFIHTTNASGQAGNDYIHLVITIAAHEIYQIREVYFDNYTVSWGTDLLTRPTGVVSATGLFGGYVDMQINYGTDAQSTLSSLITNCPAFGSFPGVTSTFRQRGHAHVYLRLKWNDTLFKGGLPDIMFYIQGNPTVIDPRTGTTTGGSPQNAAMILNDYLTNTRWGLGIPSASIHQPRLIDAVNKCEETIALVSGSLENRYLINAHFSAEDSPGEIVQDMLAVMAGQLTFTEGKWNIWAGAYRTPTITLTEDDILSDLRVVTKTPRMDSFNAVRGTFTDPYADWEENDAPQYRNSSYITADSGETVYEDLTYPLCASGTMLQRLFKLELERNRQGVMVEFTAKMKAYQAEPAENVMITNSRLGWSSKVFEVLSSSLIIEDDDQGNPYFAVRMVCKETASTVYDWNNGSETQVDLAPNTNLPSPFTISDPSNLLLASGTSYLYTRADGTVFSRIYASWTAPSDAFVTLGGRIEVQYKLSSDSSWQDSITVSGSSTFTYILDVRDGQSYDVRIRSRNAMGASGNWIVSTGHIVVGKTAAPSQVTGFAASVQGFGILFTWNSIPDLDLREYEIRVGSIGAAWSSTTLISNVRTNNYYYQTVSSGSYGYQIKAIDTSGNYSTNSSAVNLTISSPSVVQNLVASQVSSNILIDWDAPATGTFPIARYKVYKGATFGGATYLGTVDSTFFVYVESTGGSYTYWITAVDSAGNEGTQSSVTLVVYPPSDYTLKTNVLLNPNDATLSADVLNEGNGNSILAPVNTTETWQTHFTTPGYNTIQDFISGGYTYWMQPTPSGTKTAEWQYDLTTAFAQGLITITYNSTLIDGSVTVTPQISWKTNSGDPWTAGTSGSTQQFASNFRYIKVHYDLSRTTDKGYARLGDFWLRVDAKKDRDSGSITANSGDAGGTTVTFNKTFASVDAITATAQGTTALITVVDFAGGTNPTTFKVLVFDTAGTRQTATVRWSAEGIIKVL